MNDSDFHIIHRYTRREAIDDGVLVDVTSTAREAGIRIPTALTCAAWQKYVGVPQGVAGQDEKGRLWDILWMLRCAIRMSLGPCSRLMFQLHVKNDNAPPRQVTLAAVCGPGDSAEPVITIMLPDED
jgi:hypothetical protein